MKKTPGYTAGALFLTITALFAPCKARGQELPPPPPRDTLAATDRGNRQSSSRTDPHIDPLPDATTSFAGHETLPPDLVPYVFQDAGTATLAPARQYDAGPIRRLFLGRTYRDAWTTPVPIPIIDLQNTAGGLTPVERGGGLQTSSLHVMGADSNAYVLRSVQKYAARSLDPVFRGTIVSSTTQDMISNLNPWGAVMVPDVARAAGVLHTHPTLVIIPDDPSLGDFREEFAGMLVLFERKPDEDQSEAARFGYAKNIVGSEKMYEEVREDNDNQVDQRAFARARLIDMLIGDWDRHDDQWRWAEFDTQSGTRYVAVPRDRDFAFVKFDGLLNRLGRKVGGIELKRFTDFTPDITNLLGLNWQGSKLDIRFTSALTRSDWIEIADSIRLQLTDASIEQAVSRLPDPVFADIGPYTIAALQSRRDQLPAVASQYYDMLARVVDVVGSDKHERFEIDRRPDGTTEVIVYKTKKEGDVVRRIYQRAFDPHETKEIRLYGMSGNDQFIVRGTGRSDIRVRMIGGDENDHYTDLSSTPGGIYVYDTKAGNIWELGRGAHIHYGINADTTGYEDRRFELTRTQPLAALSYNSYDGLFVGLGFKFSKPGFRKHPYAARHAIFAEYAPRSSAFNGYYDGRLVDVWNGWNAHLRGTARTENNFHSFFGFGNETGENDELLYQARLQWLTASPALERRLSPHAAVAIGPLFQFTSVDPRNDLAGTQPLNFSERDLTDKYFAGVGTSLIVDTRDDLLNPLSGLRWEADADANAAVRTSSDQYVHVGSDLRYFYTLPIPGQFTMALRAGGAHNFGTFEFFQANLLGGRSNLRGFARDRFAGRSMAYASAELRTKLLEYNLYLIKGSLGAYGFTDTGRVWWDGDHSNLWHTAYGGGLWTTPFNLVVLTGGVSFSDEGPLLDIGVGFFF